MDEDRKNAPSGDDKVNVAEQRAYADPGRKGRDSGMTGEPDVHAGNVDENAGGMDADEKPDRA